MHLTYRPGNVGDDDTCAALVPEAFHDLAPEMRALMPGLWRRWLRDRTARITMVEDAERPPGTRVVGFGASVFVTDAFAAAARTQLAPPLAAQVARLVLTGRSPVLSPEAVRAANSGPGLNVLVLLIGWSEALGTEDVRWVKAKLIEAYFYTHSGYLIKEMFQEVYSTEEMERGLAIGVSLYTDYAAFLPPGIREANLPYLIGTTRDTCRDGSMVSPLFFYRPPRFFFRSGEQDVLGLALLDKGDDEIAQALNVSTATVHKRWQTIHERVAGQAPEWFPSPEPESPGRPTRGAEKRRHLLSYLRSHPEELRPVNPPAKTHKK